MSIRDQALDFLRARLLDDAELRDRLGFGPVALGTRPCSSRVLSSRLYPPEESWTHRWSWWHQFGEVKMEGEESLILLCEAVGDEDFHVLDVPRVWIREHCGELAFSPPQSKFNLFLSAEESDQFVERRGTGLEFGQWLIEV